VHTEREAQRGAAAQRALQSEIAALRDALTAARRVGKAAVVAFRIEVTAPTKPDGPLGWRHAIIRFLRPRVSESGERSWSSNLTGDEMALN